MDIINLLLSLLSIITYHLSLAYIGISVVFKKTVIPSLLLAIIAYISKMIFGAPPIIHITVIMLSCAISLHYINRIPLLLSIIGSLMSIITFMLGSLLIACPFLIKLGYKIPTEPIGSQWIYLNLAEFSIPTLVLIVIKVSKFSPAKNIVQK